MKTRVKHQLMVSGLFLVWGLGLSLIVAALMVRHEATFAPPELGTHPATTGLWYVRHILATECRCSLRIVSHLQERDAHANVIEHVLLIGPYSETIDPLISRGYQVEQLSVIDADRLYKIHSAPAMLILDPAGRIRYTGGYTNHKQSFAIQDIAIIHALLQGEVVPSLPVYGCPLSDDLQRAVDPLSLR